MKLNTTLLAIAFTFSVTSCEKEQKSKYVLKADFSEKENTSLVGGWSSIVRLNSPGPAIITTITIDEDGTYHWLDIEVYTDDGRGSRAEIYAPNTANVRHSAGIIDLKTGEEIITDEDRSLSVVSVNWSVEDGMLHWDMDMGNMGGQGMVYRRVY